VSGNKQVIKCKRVPCSWSP